MNSLPWIVVKPRTEFILNNDNHLYETNSFSIREVISTNKSSFIGSIYNFNLNTSVPINNFFNFQTTKAYYALLIKNQNKPNWFSTHILGKDIPLDIRFSQLISQYYSNYTQYSLQTQLYLMIIEETDINHFQLETYNRIEFGSKIMFDIMMKDYILAAQHYTTEIFRNLLSTYLGTGLNPFNNEVHRVIKNEDLLNLPNLSYPEFLNFCSEHNNKPNKECYITLNEFKMGDQIIVLPCLHAFIANEITKWLKENTNKCPVCRNQVGQGQLINL